MQHATPPPRHGPNAFLFVIVTVTLNMLSFGLIMPLMPELVSELTDLPLEAAAPWNGWLSMVFALANFLAMPVLGGLSDRYGRRPILLLSVGMLGLDMLIMGLAPTIGVLFIGRALAGLFSGTVSVANAYIADVTTAENRGRAFGLTGAAFGFGFIFGPVIGGLLGDIDTRLPFFAAAGVAGLNVLYGLFVLPESLAPENRRDFSWREANPFGALRHFSRIPEVGWIILAIGFYQTAHAIYPSTWNYYGAVRYGWSPMEIGLSLGAVGVASALSQGVLTGALIKRFGAARTSMFGLSMQTVAMTLFAFAGLPWMAYAIICVSAFGSVTMPAINTLTSTLTPADRQGELQGAQASIMALTLIFSPVLMTQTFSAFTIESAPVYFPGAAFLLAALITATALIPFIIGIRANRKRLQATPASDAPGTPDTEGILQSRPSQ
ncbi:MAG: TCR/Tet family MFS transporter [Henriciella sp.]|jgi:DHA1 family tetracycline resistance protein-like MFS transporter